MKTFSLWIGVLGLGLTLAAGVRADDSDDGIATNHSVTNDSVVFQSQQNRLYQDAQAYVDQYKAAKTQTQKDQDALSKLETQRSQLQQSLEELKAARKTYRRSNRRVKNQYSKKLDGYSDQKDELQQNVEQKIQDQQNALEALNAQIEQQQNVIDQDRQQEISDRKFNKQMDRYRGQNAKIIETEHARINLKNLVNSDSKTKVTMPQQNSDLASLLNKTSYTVMNPPVEQAAKKANEAVKTDVKPDADTKTACQTAFGKFIEIQKTLSKDAADKANQAMHVAQTESNTQTISQALKDLGSCDDLEKANFDQADALPVSCQSFKISDLSEAKEKLLGFRGMSGRQIFSSDDDNLRDAMMKASASAKSDIHDQCQQSFGALKAKTDDTQGATCSNDQKTQALKAIADSVIGKDPKILNEMFDLAALKMANQVSEGHQDTLESLIKQKEADLEKLGQDPRPAVKKLYEQYGKAADLEKLDYFTKNGKTRLTNENASTLLYLLSQSPSHSSDITEADAASVWAMEQVRKVTPHADIGTAKGNWMNFSSRVYLWASESSTKLTSSQIQKKMDGLSKNIDAELATAFGDLKADLQKCLACQKGETPTIDPNQMATIKATIAVLAGKPSGQSAGVDVDSMTMNEGNIDVTVKK